MVCWGPDAKRTEPDIIYCIPAISGSHVENNIAGQVIALRIWVVEVVTADVVNRGLARPLGSSPLYAQQLLVREQILIRDTDYSRA